MRDGSASHTARSVAAHRLTCERIPAPFGDPAADEALARDVAGGLEPPPGRIHDYLRARTAFFDRVVVNALGRGVRQVVIGAAGYDGRAFRYARRGVRWFEADHPATQADKRARLDRLGIDASGVSFVAADFTVDSVAERLLAAGLDPGKPALFCFEGIAVYLDNAVTERVLAQFRQVTPAGSGLAISVSTSSGERARERFAQRVAAVGEPVRSALRPGEARELLTRAGWLPRAPGSPRQERAQAAGLLSARAVPGPAPAAVPVPAPAVTLLTPVAPGEKPLSALLSHALVAYTIEFDNEFEHRMAHRTTGHGPAAGPAAAAPWLTSLAMWETCVRHVPDEGITVADLRRAARAAANLDGMRRWGYATLTAPSGRVAARSGRASSHPKITDRTVVRLTDWGRRADAVWRELDTEIEARWRSRLGPDAVGALRDALAAIAGRLDPSLPDCLPILGHGMFTRPAPGGETGTPPEPRSLLSRVLTGFAVEYEEDSRVSLAIGANVVRSLSAGGVRPRDIPARSGVSKEGAAMALTWLRNADLAVAGPDPAASRGTVVRLTPAGTAERERYAVRAAGVEAGWRERFGAGPVTALREALEGISGSLADGLRPYPEGWRREQAPRSVPDYPMILHRGGYPDGA